MSEKKTFDCPSCFAPMVFAGGTAIFQTCETCMAPIIVPSEFLYGTNALLESEKFASLMNDKPVNVEQVTNELTPGDSLPEATIADEPDALIEQFDVYQEKIGTGSVAEKAAFDMAASGRGNILEVSPIALERKQEDVAILDLVRNELNLNRKVTAIKIFREEFGCSLQAAKAAVEAFERGEIIDFANLESAGE